MNFCKDTLNVICDLHGQGIEKVAAIIRHSARNYDDDSRMEPFMCLTDEGKSFCSAFGEGLPDNRALRLYSSHIGRCIETAYLVDKGYSKNGGKTDDTIVVSELSPFYVLDFMKTIEIIKEHDLMTFIRNWIDGKFDESILMSAEASVRQMITFITDQLNTSDNGALYICVSHDWNIYLLKELGLNLPHEEYGKIDYLEGIVIYENNGEFYITNHQMKQAMTYPQFWPTF